MKDIFLKEKYNFFIKPRPPFNFIGTVCKPSHFPTPIIVYGKNEVIHTITIKGKVFALKLNNHGSVDNPLVLVTFYSDQEISENELSFLKEEISWRYGFDEDISNFYNKFINDDLLGPVLQKRKGMRISCIYSLYELLIITIVLQNANVRRTTEMLSNLFKKYGRKVKVDRYELYAFWQPEILAAASENELKNLKVGYRAKFLKAISKSFKNNEINEEHLRTLGKEEAKNILLKLRGIGPVSVQILLIESLRHFDALEIIPPWEQKIYSRLLLGKELVPTEEILTEITKRWGEWKALAIHYLFEDLFWRMKEEKIEWLERLIRS